MNEESKPGLNGPGSRVPSLSALKTFRPQLGDPRSVYIHVPFCRHRCGYCNFTLVAGRDYLIERFLTALEFEIGWLDRKYEIDTLFLGGGTPSHLSPGQLERLSKILRTRFVLTDSAEVTAECNPNDLNADRMAALANLGVNRISLGVQSLNPNKLKKLERDHTAIDVRNAVDTARKHAAKVSLDLIFAAPGESLAGWMADLKAAISLGPNHLSTYELTYEKGTRFWNSLNRGDLSRAEEDLRAEMYESAIIMLDENGFSQYEVSSFANAADHCRHNLAYWNGSPFFAFGPGAARFVDGIRETNHQSTTRYLKLVEQGESPVADREHLVGEAAAREGLAIRLRVITGFSGSEFHRQTGHSVSEILGEIEIQLVNNGLLIHEQDIWRLTPRGILVCDSIASEIVGGSLKI